MDGPLFYPWNFSKNKKQLSQFFPPVCFGCTVISFVWWHFILLGLFCFSSKNVSIHVHVKFPHDCTSEYICLAGQPMVNIVFTQRHLLHLWPNQIGSQIVIAHALHSKKKFIKRCFGTYFQTLFSSGGQLLWCLCWEGLTAISRESTTE